MQAIMDAQERFYSDNVSYTTDLTRLGINDPFITPKGVYSIAARQCTQAGVQLPLSQCVELVATGLNAQAQDGDLITNTIGRQQRVLGADTFTW
ncbi:MAG: type IV pilin protein [Saccharospirillaceae bacterium]|nr:type IV pilin protein [Saccharospirillaceae bacterium]